MQNSATTDYKHRKFIERVVEFEVVWGLKSDFGWVSSPSNDEAALDVLPFWSDRAYAKLLAREEWQNYQPTEIPLADFLEHWLPGMFKDEVLAGTNWDASLNGKECHPLKLALELIDHLKSKNKHLILNGPGSLAALESQFKKDLKGKFALQSYMTIEELITSIRRKEEESVCYAVYGMYGQPLVPGTKLFIDFPIEVNESDQEIYPEAAGKEKLDMIYSSELLQDVVNSVLDQKRDATFEEFIKALIHYDEHDDFLDL